MIFEIFIELVFFVEVDSCSEIVRFTHIEYRLAVNFFTDFLDRFHRKAVRTCDLRVTQQLVCVIINTPGADIFIVKV